MTLHISPAMTSHGSPSQFAFTDQDFAVIARLAREDFGLSLSESKKELVYSRLVKRVRVLALSDFRSYCQRLESPGGSDERIHMLSALTTNVTHFFREGHHFQMLRTTVLPPLIARARAGGRVRLWSAGCSAGQEPFSLAFTVLDLCPEAAKLDLRILATDVDPVIIARAREGRYDDEEAQSIPDPVSARFCGAATDGKSGVIVNDKARAILTFGELNLMADWPMHGTFDIIFCRNVAIYFDKDVQARLWHRFAALIPESGYLFIGHSERLAGPAEPLFTSVGVTSYRKISGPAATTQTAPKVMESGN